VCASCLSRVYAGHARPRAILSNKTVQLHRAATRGLSTQRGVQESDHVLLVALASCVAQGPCSALMAGVTATKTEGPPSVQETWFARAAIEVII